jgi:cyanate permease
MNTITMFSGFVGPYWMGVMKDATGSYQAGLRGLALPAIGAAAVMFVLTQNLKKRVSIPLMKANEIAT